MGSLSPSTHNSMQYFTVNLFVVLKYFWLMFHDFTLTPLNRIFSQHISKDSFLRVEKTISHKAVSSTWMDRSHQGLSDAILCFVCCDRLCFLLRHTGLFTNSQSMLDVDLSCMSCILFSCVLLSDTHLEHNK